MPKSESKKSKRKKGSSTDEELVNNNKCKWEKGGPSGVPLGDDSVISVSDILSEVNSVLYENSQVFDDLALPTEPGVPNKSTSMASNSTRDMSSIATSKDDSCILLQAIFDRLTKIELKLETLTTVANKVENFEKEIKLL
ncbi:hypothetical protein DPMN_117341 [Dreissena polymorpha]|uniref:Uncharacterized protein n=1 Tax=Dreissena polymorpha TaxID=45954 RepID=A0A9D4QVK6_DREPO|nr:hypothetical protein DPMN_117341 [Dreissena polymorpha]